MTKRRHGGRRSVGGRLCWGCGGASWHYEHSGIDVAAGDGVGEWAAWVGFSVGVCHACGGCVVCVKVFGELGEPA